MDIVPAAWEQLAVTRENCCSYSFFDNSSGSNSSDLQLAVTILEACSSDLAPVRKLAAGLLYSGLLQAKFRMATQVSLVAMLWLHIVYAG